MTDVVFTHEFDTEETSSVIEHVYYSEPEKLLFVQLHSGVLCGYAHVSLDIFTALDALNTNRLNGDTGSSVGSYWNVYIKPNLVGYDTADVELLSVEEAEEDRLRQEKLNSLLAPGTQSIASSGFWTDLLDNNALIGATTIPSATILPVDPPKPLARFKVSFGDSGKVVGLNVRAVDIDDAIDRFEEAVGILGWEPVTIQSVTKFLN